MKWLIVLSALLVICQTNISISPKHETQRDWYETAIFYQIHSRSFKDGNGDGIGDIKGIMSKLEHLKEMGVGGAWISSIFKSPMEEFSYDGRDISNFTDIQEEYGTLDDVVALFERATELDIKIILDFVPNHTSDQCEWFTLSVQNDTKYRDYYIWSPGTIVNDIPVPPNNWNSVYNGSAWSWSETRQEFYLHQFNFTQPDLNYRNPDVVEEMKNVLLFWLEKGASGFKVDTVNYLFEVEDLRDEPINNPEDALSYGHTHKHYTKDLDEMYDMIYQWRTLLDDFQKNHGGETKIMITEADTNETFTMKFYQNVTHQGSHIPLNFVLINDLTAEFNASDLKKVIDNRIDALPSGKVINWVLGNDDQTRIASRYGPEKVDALLTLVMTLPGIAVTYYGEEIGMVDNRFGISFEETLDPQTCNKYAGLEEPEEGWQWSSRDPQRTPFQWDDSDSAGFCECEKPWLPVNDNYLQLNLALQKSWRKSTFNHYKELSTLRRDHTIMEGSYESFVEKDVFLYIRALNDHGSRLVLINFGDTEQVVNVTKYTNMFGEKLKVLVAGAESEYEKHDILDTNDVYLKKFNAIVVENYSGSGSITLSFSLYQILYLSHPLNYNFRLLNLN